MAAVLASVRMAAQTDSQAVSARVSSRSAAGWSMRVNTTPVPAARMRSTARRSVTRSRPASATRCTRARRISAPAAATAWPSGVRSAVCMSRNSSGLARPKPTWSSQPARRPSIGSASGADGGLVRQVGRRSRARRRRRAGRSCRRRAGRSWAPARRPRAPPSGWSPRPAPGWPAGARRPRRAARGSGRATTPGSASSC